MTNVLKETPAQRDRVPGPRAAVTPRAVQLTPRAARHDRVWLGAYSHGVAVPGGALIGAHVGGAIAVSNVAHYVAATGLATPVQNVAASPAAAEGSYRRALNSARIKRRAVRGVNSFTIAAAAAYYASSGDLRSDSELLHYSNATANRLAVQPPTHTQCSEGSVSHKKASN